MIGAFARLRLHDRQPTGLHSLPNEVLLRIAEFLVPDPVSIGRNEVPFLRTREIDEWTSFFKGRENLANLSGVSRRFQDIARPLVYRNTFLQKPSSLCQLIVQLALKPSLRPVVRHINSAIDLSSDKFDEYWDAWWSALPRYFTEKTTPDTAASSPILLFSLLDDWSDFSPKRKMNFPSFLLASLLGTTNRIEKIGVLLPRIPTEPGGRLSTLWMWLLKRGIWPFPDPRRESHHNTGTFNSTYPTMPTAPRLKTAPFWPPPFLHNVVAEYYRGTSCGDCIIQLDIVPHSESVQHAALLRHCELGLLNPAFLLSPLHLGAVLGSRHLQLLNYLDGLKKTSQYQGWWGTAWLAHRQPSGSHNWPRYHGPRI
jgi:hypothetical protein